MSVSINEVAKKYLQLNLNLPKKSVTIYEGNSWHSNVEYIWIENIPSAKLLSKTQKTLHSQSIHAIRLKDIPKSIYNINTGHANWPNKKTGLLYPVLLRKDPFRPENKYESNGLVLCQNTLSNSEPTASTKNRLACVETIEYKNGWQFEIEQEFSFREKPTITSIADKDYIRKTLESFNRACIYAGISINSFSIENHPQNFLSYKIGPCDGLQVSDELWMSRYVLQRVAEEFHLTPSFDPIANGDQVRCPRALYSFSAGEMIGNRRVQIAEKFIQNMELSHRHDIDSYNSTSDFTKDHLWEDNTMGEFSEVVTISSNIENNGNVYILDLRPRGNSDPYVITKTIVTSVYS